MFVTSGAVMTFFVMTSLVRRLESAKRTSLPVTIPTSFSASTTGRPEMLCFCISLVGYSTVSVGLIVITSFITRDSARFTFFETVERSEEHTSELQSRSDLVCRLLLEKKKKRYEI